MADQNNQDTPRLLEAKEVLNARLAAHTLEINAPKLLEEINLLQKKEPHILVTSEPATELIEPTTNSKIEHPDLPWGVLLLGYFEGLGKPSLFKGKVSK